MLKTIPFAYSLWLTGLGILMGCSPLSQTVDKEKVQPPQPIEANTVAIESLASVETANPPLQPQINEYINRLANMGFNPQTQGIWIQSGGELLANYRGTQPLPSASIAKVATTLVALHRFGPDHRFKTRIGTTGTLENGILEGDLIIEGGEDPFFVWEEAVRIGNLLHELGIKRITGDLVIVGKFYMNFQQSPLISGNLLKQGLNANIWPAAAEQQYQTLSPDTPRPQLLIDGEVITTTKTPNNVTFRLEQSSFPVAELLKKMNRYSNTQMSNMFNDALGGTQTVAQTAAKLAGVRVAEIQLGSGDRISPRAAVAMFLAIGKSLEPHQMKVGDVFAIVGQDEGLLQKRQLPAFSVLKSGIWTNIGALSGAIPTEKQDIIWFAVMNFGQETEKSQQEQEIFLEQVLNNLGTVSTLPKQLSPSLTRKTKTSSVRKL